MLHSSAMQKDKSKRELKKEANADGRKGPITSPDGREPKFVHQDGDVEKVYSEEMLEEEDDSFCRGSD